MPIYKIKVQGQDKERLVKASTLAGARNHVLKSFIVESELVEGEALFALAKAGVELEDASAPDTPPVVEKKDDDDPK